MDILQMLTDVSREYSAYMTVVTRFIKAHYSPDTQVLKEELKAVHEEFGAEIIETE